MKTLAKLEKTIGSTKFAVIIILLFAVALTVGTFVESLYNTEYAGRLIYKSLPFMLLQLAMFLSIFIATTLRFPFKRALFGFYVLHLGLLLIFVGSFVTYVVGVDGSMQLLPNTPSRTVSLPQYELEVTDLKAGKKLVMDLPYVASPTEINESYQDLHFKTYLPFAKLERHWIKSHIKGVRSSQYQIKNENFAETFLLSSHPDSEGQASLTMGLLNVHYLPMALSRCFEIQGESQPEFDPFIIWDTKKDRCIQASKEHSTLKRGENNQMVLTYTQDGQDYTFMPQVSPLPINATGDSGFRVFSKKLFEDKPHLFAFGDKIAFFDKNENKWMSSTVSQTEPVALPWMGFEITLIKDARDLFPKKIPMFSPPKADKPRVKALMVSFQEQDFWLTSGESLTLGNYEISLSAQKIKLPFQINLERFHMDNDPGTKNPASYESTVSLFDGTSSLEQKVFMNNPLDWDRFTFYQASYFPLENGLYGSVLSVNYDPGRFLKYFGSLLLVLGSFWHFYLRKQKWNWLKL